MTKVTYHLNTVDKDISVLKIVLGQVNEYLKKVLSVITKLTAVFGYSNEAWTD